MVEAVETFPEIHVENLPDLSKYQLELATDILVVKPAMLQSPVIVACSN